MSIEKTNFNYLRQQKLPSTTIPTGVLQNIKDTDVLAVYCYLASLPCGWEVNRKHLMNHFQKGRDKIDHVLKWLNNNHLLEYHRERKEDGKLGIGFIIVKDGIDFVKNVVNNQEHNTRPLKTSGVAKRTRPLKNPGLVKPGSGKSGTYINNNIYNNKDNIKAERALHSVAPTSRSRSRSISPSLSLQTFQPNQEHIILAQDLRVDIDRELESFKVKGGKYKNNLDQGFKIWLKMAKEHQDSKPSKPQEIRSTVPWFGPGHPTYDSLYPQRKLNSQGANYGQQKEGLRL